MEKLDKIAENSEELYYHADCCRKDDFFVAEATVIHVEVRVVTAFTCKELEPYFKENAQVFGEHVL